MARRIYRSRDGRADYVFSFERQPNGTFRLYIDWQPGYGGRDTGAHSTHRYQDGARPYICYTAPIAAESEAEQVARAWAERTERYIRTGARF